MEAARPRMEEGYVEDVACAIAAALRRRPLASASFLLGGVVAAMTEWFWLDPALFLAWIASASFLAGAALAGPQPLARDPWTVAYRVGAFLAIAVVAAAVWSRGPADDEDLSGGGVVASSRFAVVALAFLLGFGLRNVVTITCAAGLAAMTFAPAALVHVADAHSRECIGHPALYAGWLAIVAMLLVARRGRWTLALFVAVAAVLWRESVLWDFWGMSNLSPKDTAGFTESFVLAAAAVLLPVCAGRAAAAVARDERGDPWARFVVRVQRDPWRTSLIAVVVGTAFFRSVEPPSPAWLLVAVAAFSCLAHCAAGVSFAALAPWLAAAVISVPLSFSLMANLKDRYFELKVLPEALIVVYVPVVVGAVVANTRSLRWPWWGCATALVGEATMLLIVWQDPWPAMPRWGDNLARDASWCIIVSLVVHAVATSEVRAWRVLALSPLVSTIVFAGFFGVRTYYGESSGFIAALVAGPAAALLGLAARRIRSMTAIPDDHASFELAALRAASLAPAPNP